MLFVCVSPKLALGVEEHTKVQTRRPMIGLRAGQNMKLHPYWPV